MITEEACVKEHGGHHWKYFSYNTVVDEHGNDTGRRTLLCFPEGEPMYRICPLCGRREAEKKEWKIIGKA